MPLPQPNADAHEQPYQRLFVCAVDCNRVPICVNLRPSVASIQSKRWRIGHARGIRDLMARSGSPLPDRPRSNLSRRGGRRCLAKTRWRGFVFAGTVFGDASQNQSSRRTNGRALARLVTCPLANQCTRSRANQGSAHGIIGPEGCGRITVAGRRRIRVGSAGVLLAARLAN